MGGRGWRWTVTYQFGVRPVRQRELRGGLGDFARPRRMPKLGAEQPGQARGDALPGRVEVCGRGGGARRNPRGGREERVGGGVPGQVARGQRAVQVPSLEHQANAANPERFQHHVQLRRSSGGERLVGELGCRQDQCCLGGQAREAQSGGQRWIFLALEQGAAGAGFARDTGGAVVGHAVSHSAHVHQHERQLRASERIPGRRVRPVGD
mmetsp:Transcript_63311/g.181639  ORF Transcript_63311/g.181639 Transcript_63311/m.181639 type:complete len:209 (-) Transcript_63311:404-1030(-)